jgi:hypothetical protein
MSAKRIWLMSTMAVGKSVQAALKVGREGGVTPLEANALLTLSDPVKSAAA